MLSSTFSGLGAAAAEVVAWGDNSYGQTNVPSGLSNVVAIAGQDHSLALTAEGRVVAWGYNDYGQRNVPGGLSNVVAIAAGGYHSLALVGNALVLANSPFILGKPRQYTVFSGVPVNLYTVATVPQPLSFQWWHDGHSIANGTNNLLTLRNVQPADSGSYSVVVTNSIGSVTGLVAVVTVTDSPPFIVANPQSQQKFLGEPAIFSVLADGSGPLTYQWSFNSFPLKGATSATLTITNLQLADSGVYTVSVPNRFGAVLSLPVSLGVQPPTLWDSSAGTIVISKLFVVPNGSALTILPGTIVKFAGSGSGLLVRGRLEIKGTPEQPVVLTSIRDDSVGGDSNGDGNATVPAAGNWSGIEFTNPNLMSDLQCFELRYSSSGLSVGSYNGPTSGNAKALRASLRHNQTAIEAGSRTVNCSFRIR